MDAEVPGPEELGRSLDGRTVEGGPSLRLLVRIDTGKKTVRPEATAVLTDGVARVTDGDAEPDVALTLSPADGAALVAGRLDLPVAYMRGDAKLEGDPGPVVDVVRWFEGLGLERPAR